MNRLLVVLPVVLAACTPESSDSVPKPAAAFEAKPSASAPWVRPIPSQGGSGLSVPAQVVQTADSEAVVVAPLQARVLEVHVKPGDEVSEGDPIAAVVMPELETAVAQMRGAEGEYAVLRARHDRLEALQREGLAVKGDVVALEIDLARADATRTLALAVLSGAGLSRAGTHVLRSPIDGIVVSTDARLGEVRLPGDGPLATIRKTHGQRVAALLPRRVDPQTAPMFVREGAPAVPLIVVSSIVDGSGFGYRTWFEPVGDAELEAAARGRVEFEIDIEGEAWRVPEESVVRDAEGTYVLAAGDREPVRVPVELVRVEEGVAFVRGALNEDMRIDTDPERAEDGSAEA